MLKDFKRDEALRYLIKHPNESLYDIYGQPWTYDKEKNVIFWTFKIDDYTEEDEIDIEDFRIKFPRSAEFSLILPDE